MRYGALTIAICLYGCQPDSTATDARHEGTEAGDCADRADNDQDGRFDCDDEGCAGSPDCRDVPGTDADDPIPLDGGTEDASGTVDAGPTGDATPLDAAAPRDAVVTSDRGGLADAGLAPPEPRGDPCADRPTVRVSTEGADGPDCGADDAPCGSIRHALSLAADGDAVCVGPGTYAERWIQVPTGVWLVGVDGPSATAIASGTLSAVRFDGVERAGVQGFEVYGEWGAGDPGDGLVRVLDSTDITVRDMIIHDGPNDQDCLKVSGRVTRLLMDRLVAWNPGPRTDSDNFQEVVDIAGITRDINPGGPPPVSDVTLRGSWLFHVDGVGDWLTYTKINTEKIIFENNIFGPSAGRGYGNGAVGVGTGEAGRPVAESIVANHVIVRNNVFVGNQGDATLAVQNAADVWIYGNTFFANSGDNLRAIIMLRGNQHPLGRVRILGNIFQNNHPGKDGETFIWERSPRPDDFTLDYNLYLDNIEHSEVAYREEAHGVYDVDPGLFNPGIPATDVRTLARISEIAARFGIGADSPARGAGLDVVGEPGHPNWRPGVTDRRWDLLGRPRPPGAAADLGALQGVE